MLRNGAFSCFLLVRDGMWLITEVLVKRKGKLEKELESIEKSIKALAHMEKS